MRRPILAMLALVLFPATALSQDLSNELKDLDWIGFQQFAEASRVFVRTTEPVKYRVDDSNPKSVVLVLENTNIPLRNNRRPLDTRFFDGPVRRIVPKILEGPSTSVRIEIKVSQKVPYKVVQNDNFLALDFTRPAE